MGAKTAIEWTGSTWTPIRARNKTTGKVGWHCEHATTGCVHCYSEAFNLRLGTGLPFKPGHREDIELFLDEKLLLEPLKWRKPRQIFVCSMTDLFADFVPDAWIDRIFAVMELCPQHTFQVLTKRSARMRAYASSARAMPRSAAVRRAMEGLWLERNVDAELPEPSWPLPNVWLGVSAERQQEADERVPHLLATPAAVRFVSLEPLLGPIDLTRVCLLPKKKGSHLAGIHLDALRGKYCESGCDYVGEWFQPGDCCMTAPPDIPPIHLDWAIVGGESGRDARIMHPDWVRPIRDSCTAAGVAFFLKQWGEHVAGYLDGDDFVVDEDTYGPNVHWRGTAQCIRGRNGGPLDLGEGCWGKVGKKAAGRLLDGRTWDEMPNTRRET